MTDVIFFAGPVQLKPQFFSIDWFGRDVRIVPIGGHGSSYFAQLGAGLRDSSGRIVPGLLRRYAPGLAVDKVVLAAFSAGHGLVNEVGKNPADRELVSAVMLHDAVYLGHANAASGNLPDGLLAWTLDAARGRLLCVSTTSGTPGPTYLSADVSEGLIWGAAAASAGLTPRSVDPARGAPPGEWQRLGKEAYWGALPLSHLGQHDSAPSVWQAYLAPYLAEKGLPPWVWIGGAAALAGGALYAISKGTS